MAGRAPIVGLTSSKNQLMDVLRNHVIENGMGWRLESGIFAYKPQCKTLDEAMEELLR